MLDDRTAILMLTHVNYRTGFMHDMAALTERAHKAGVLVIWDLAHSAGAVPVDLITLPSRGRLCGRLRLQIPERRAGRAGVCLGASATHRVDGSNRMAATTVGMARSRRAVRVLIRTTSRPGASRVSSAARRPCCRSPPSSAASTRCSPLKRPAASPRLGRNRSRLTQLFIDARRATLRGTSTHARITTAGAGAWQSGIVRPSNAWLRDHAGADRPRRDRRLPRARHPALRVYSALHAVHATCGTPSIACGP